ncbi:MAG: acyltransferase [Methyloprofundus sp.]|nr:acyltransferase [Methyloprofundus sp.]
MRKINAKPIITFSILFIPTVIFSIYFSVNILSFIPLGEYKAITNVISSIFMIYLFNIIVYRIFLWKMPLKEGEYIEDSKEDFIYHVYVLYYLILFNPLTPSLLVPVPLMRLIYIGLGAKLGENTYSAGAILDPPLVELGSNTIIGYDSVLCPHAVEGTRVVFKKIKIGNNVTIGMKSIIMAGVTIEDGGIVAAGSVVTKGTYIKTGDLWAGTPAKLLKASEQTSPT